MISFQLTHCPQKFRATILMRASLFPEIMLEFNGFGPISTKVVLCKICGPVCIDLFN